MSTCTEEWQHTDPDSKWDHETKMQEDSGEMHTDDCIDHCARTQEVGHDFENCTSGQPGSLCRVKLVREIL